MFPPDWIESAKYIFPSLGLLCVALFLCFRAPRFDFQRGLLLSVLLATTVGAGLFYANNELDPKKPRYLNSYEFFHYYLGSKYWPELGYSDLYASALVAQSELGQKNLPTTVRDLKAGRAIIAANVLRDAAQYKAKFSPERWQAFKSDVSFFRGNFRGTKGWQKMMNDKGYNPAPMWTLVGGTLSNAIPTSSYGGMLALASIDLALMALAAGFLVWAFGPRAMLFMALVLFTQYVSSHTHMKGSFMRMDWIIALIIAACLIKKDYWKTAGVLLGWAACSRIFPAVFGFGIGAKLLWDLVLKRKLNRQYLEFLVACGVTVVVMAAASWLYTGTEYWREFLTKIGDHNDDISPWRVGFKYVWLLSYQGGNLALQYENSMLAFRAIQAAVLLLSVGLVRKLDNFEAFCFGIVPMFLLVAPTYYYYIVVLMPALFFISKMDLPSRAVGVGLVFVEGMLAHYGHAVWDRTAPQFFAISVMMMILIVYLMVLSGLRLREQEIQPPAAA